jgi:hypothetical protein
VRAGPSLLSPALHGVTICFSAGFDRPLPPAMPRIGLPIKVPKTEKPGSCSRATKFLDGEVAVETKYDGERCVPPCFFFFLAADRSLLQASDPHRSFSSLPRTDSYLLEEWKGQHSDSASPSRVRCASPNVFPLPAHTQSLLVHSIIRASLSLPLDPISTAMHPLLHKRLLASPDHFSLDPPSKLVLEGEMVPYDESRRCIDEFWKLDCAKAGFENPPPPSFSCAGEKRRREEESHETGQTGATPSPRYSAAAFSPVEGVAGGVRGTALHLMVVWFDLLVVGRESLLGGSSSLHPLSVQSLSLTSSHLLQSRTNFGVLASHRSFGPSRVSCVFSTSLPSSAPRSDLSLCRVNYRTPSLSTSRILRRHSTSCGSDSLESLPNEAVRSFSQAFLPRPSSPARD